MGEYTQRDLMVNWHPFTQMLTAPPPVTIVRAKEALLFDEEGKSYIDAISSWWVNIHGHCNPRLLKRVSEQMSKLDHVLFAGFTHPPAVEFSENLLDILPSNQSRIFYSDNGSTGIEVAIKMAIQFWYNLGIKRHKIIALEGAYHGDTFGAMSAGERSSFSAPFTNLLFDVEFIPSPGRESSENVLQAFEKVVFGDHVAAFIFEPLIQGAGGMLMYEPEVLDEMLAIARKAKILTIADEVMTGFGRTGRFFACDYLTSEPDIMVFSKGITGGILPLGATSCSNEIYEAFLSNNKLKAFFHGHSYTANPVTLAAAHESLQLLTESREQLSLIEEQHEGFIKKLSRHPKVDHVRMRGTVLAFNIKTGEDTSYFNTIREQLYNSFLEKGVLLRPLGNVIYIMPPYCITREQLNEVYSAVMKVLGEL